MRSESNRGLDHPESHARRFGDPEAGLFEGQSIGGHRQVFRGIIKIASLREEIADRRLRIGRLEKGAAPVVTDALVDGFGRSLQPNDESCSRENLAILWLGHDASSRRDDLIGLFGTGLQDFRFQSAKGLLAILFKNLRDRFAGSLGDPRIRVHEAEAETAGDSLSDCGLARSHESDQNQIARLLVCRMH